MALDGCMKCLKYLVFIFNLIFWICGMAVLGIAIWLRLDPTTQKYVAAADDSRYYIGCYILMGAGGLMTLVGFLGCCGAYQENRCMLATFFSFLLLILIAEIGAGVYAYLNREEIEHRMSESMKDVVQKEYGVSDTRTEGIDFLQQEGKCCGSEGKEDYTGSEWAKKQSMSVPDSCCEDKACGPVTGLITNPKIFKTGCSSMVIEWFKEHLLIIMIVGFLIGVVEVLGMIFSMALCCALQRRYKGYTA